MATSPYRSRSPRRGAGTPDSSYPHAFNRLPSAALARRARSTRAGSEAGGSSPGHSTPRSDRGSDWRPSTYKDSGVPEAIREFIFQPFFTTKPRGRGTGLGLSLARATARQHGGTIRVDNAPTGGARFVMEFPLPPPV